MENGWSMQHLHRLIVTSAAYRSVESRGPGGCGLSGEPRTRSRQPLPLAHESRRAWKRRSCATACCISPAFSTRRSAARNSRTPRPKPAARRSLYFSCHPEIGGRSAMAAMFDAPEPTDCYRRTRSVLPQQALVLTNSRLVHDHSAALARRVSANADDPRNLHHRRLRAHSESRAGRARTRRMPRVSHRRADATDWCACS